MTRRSVRLAFVGGEPASGTAGFSREAGIEGAAISPVLQVAGLSVRFHGTGANVVDSVDLTVAAGETLAIVGESGCGKSVTALALMGLLPQNALVGTAGVISFEGVPVAGAGLARLRGDRIAMIFQEPMSSLNPAIRIGEQIAEAVRRHRSVGRAAARARALEMLRKVGIPAPEARLDEFPHQLSGGMRQRVMIAMALANDPAVLIADEPTTALDVTIQAQILDLIAELGVGTGMATILITHDLGVVAEVADRVAVMYAGHVVETAPAGEIFANPQHPYTIGLMGSVPRLTGPRDRLATVPGVVPTVDAMPPGCRFSSRCPFAAPVCSERPRLDPVSAEHRVACHFAPLEERLELSA
jgi:peptide/nickel transport system ATP-binding protein